MAFASHTLRVDVSMVRDGVPLRIPKGQLGPNGEKPGTFAYTGGAGSQSGLADRNRGLAMQAQRQIGTVLQESILRPNVKTGRLLRATMDPANIVWDRNGFAIGDADFLDKSQAKYWRTIDQGTEHWKHPFVGSVFYVFKAKAWGATLAGYDDKRSFAGPPWRRSKQGGGGDMFNPIKRSTYDEIFENTYEVGGKAVKGEDLVGEVEIKRDIVAKHYYERGFLQSGVIERGVRSYWLEFSKYMP